MGLQISEAAVGSGVHMVSSGRQGESCLNQKLRQGAVLESGPAGTVPTGGPSRRCGVAREPSPTRPPPGGLVPSVPHSPVRAIPRPGPTLAVHDSA